MSALQNNLAGVLGSNDNYVIVSLMNDYSVLKYWIRDQIKGLQDSQEYLNDGPV